MVSLNPGYFNKTKKHSQGLQQTYLLLHSKGFLQKGVQNYTYVNTLYEILSIFKSCPGNITDY